MTIEEKAASLARDIRSRDEIVALLRAQQEAAALKERVAELEQRLQWFQRQIFGEKSERRIDGPDGAQMTLGEPLAAGAAPAAPPLTIPSHTRNRAKKAWEGATNDSGLRFDPSVPVVDIKVPNPDTEIYPPDSYDVIDQRVTCRLAQLPGTYVVLRYTRDVLKLKRAEDQFSCPPAPAAVIEKSYADVSFLTGLLIDKFIYHLPLYRLHQRLGDSGIRLARGTLTNLVHQSATLLRPIYDAQMQSIRAGGVIAIDETPIRAGRKPDKKGLQNAYFWPVYGDRDEIAFHFAASRARAVLDKLLEGFAGTYVSDGYRVYDIYEQSTERVQRAQCWSHTRREFIEAEAAEPDLARTALGFIRDLYAQEARIRDLALEDEKKLEHRAEHSKPIVDAFFGWLDRTLRDRILLPSSPFTKAAAYVRDRKNALYVFLENPAVPIDTNHLEREIRPIALGRKNWLFCWTEIGAEYVGVVQSLLRTCRLQGIDPYTYLVDVLQRVATHPAADVHTLTPRLWKQTFAENPLRSDLDSSRSHADSLTL